MHYAQRETAPLPAPSLVHYAWTGPLRLALAGATRSGTAGGESLFAVQYKHTTFSRLFLDLPQSGPTRKRQADPSSAGSVKEFGMWADVQVKTFSVAKASA